MFTWVLPHLPVAPGEPLGRVPMPGQTGHYHWICRTDLSKPVLGGYLGPQYLQEPEGLGHVLVAFLHPALGTGPGTLRGNQQSKHRGSTRSLPGTNALHVSVTEAANAAKYSHFTVAEAEAQRG